MYNLCIASNNIGKLEEIQSMLDCVSFNIYSQSHFNIQPIVETGSTFAENAILKARNAAFFSNLPTIADDSGLCIDVLEQDPGVKSSDYAGKNATTKQNIQKIIDNIALYGNETIHANLVTVICFMKNSTDPAPLLITEKLDGELLHESRGQLRGYDSIFYLPKLGKSIGELSISEKNQISPRGRAIKKLQQQLQIY
jgi:XTP/dITP diphosphohydrolase